MPRLAKFISNAGVCSRRQAELLILQGRIKVNNRLITILSTNIEDEDEVTVDDKIINLSPTPRLFTYYKPSGLITTSHDPQGRPTIYTQLKNLPRVVSIGRLDLLSEGLLLLTNNGDLARKFELPSSNIERIYKVRAYGNASKLLKFIKNIQPSILEIDGLIYNIQNICLLNIENTNAHNKWFEVKLNEGKNREIRKIFNYFNLQVNRLIRTNYGPFDLENLKPGNYYEQPYNKFKNFL